jgi:hypothetical protein
MNHKQKLQELFLDYPIPNNWSKPEFIHDIIKINNVPIEIVGLSSKNKQNQEVTGSAGGYTYKLSNVFNLPRAYYELLERTTIIDSINSGKLILPTPQHSKSNGIAAGTTPLSTQDSARFELIERDSILRSWFGQIKPKEYENVYTYIAFPKELNEFYEFKFYTFTNKINNLTEVVGVFGFPKKLKYPLVYGFGADRFLEDAAYKAERECIQRLGFLWNEEIPKSKPKAYVSPMFHQDYFLYPKNHKKIINWLDGKTENYLGEYEKKNPEFRYIDLTPKHLRGKMHVVKAECNDCLPLIFGGGDYYGENIPKKLRVHPIA